MGTSEAGQQPQGDKLRKAIQWISDTQLEKPQMKRQEILAQAEMRFDLSPKECAFLNNNFTNPTS